MEEFPPLVARAHELARRPGFPLTREQAGPGQPSACLPGTGRFLAVLAAVMSSRGPFDLLFADSGVRGEADFATLVGLLRPGGRIVMGDLTPQHALAPDSPLLASDLKRQLFTHPGLTSAEVVLPGLQNSLLAGTVTGN
jgi:predicted O-methyltransferase YrrM